jgi:hypothetical protein
MNQQEAADYLGVSPRAIERYTQKGKRARQIRRGQNPTRRRHQHTPEGSQPQAPPIIGGERLTRKFKMEVVRLAQFQLSCVFN